MTQEWGEGVALQILMKNVVITPMAPLSLTLSPLRREREFMLRCSPSYKLQNNVRWAGNVQQFTTKDPNSNPSSGNMAH